MFKTLVKALLVVGILYGLWQMGGYARSAFWVAIALMAVVFIVETAFLVIVSGKILEKRGLLEGELRDVVGFWLVVGWPCDVLFNWWRGSWMFKERPRKWTFSSRIQYHIDHLDKSKRPMKALRWADVLNIDDGHIDNVPEVAQLPVTRD